MRKYEREFKKRYNFKPIAPLEEDVWNIAPDRCKKKRFTKDDAKRLIKNAKMMRKKYKGYRRTERGYYYCKRCCAYHVTSYAN
jgi:hypothetical protein